MAHCFTPIRGRRIRVTKVNALGRPVYGPNAFVVTGGFVSVQFSPQIQEAEEITVRTADGSLCVSERGCDELQWIEVQIEFCQVDPCLFTLINETWTELRDCVGEVIGWAESYRTSCNSGFGLELWTDVTGYTPTTPGATSAFGYMLLPFIVGGTLGEQTVENGAVTFTITGRTKKGSGWGVGPYDVMCNDPVTGACGPLLTPVGPEEPRRIFLTTCPPPAAACGCQPLSAPDGPVITTAEVDPGAGQPRRRVSVTLPAGTIGTYRMSWGDASPAEPIAAGATLTHTYDRDGTYNISVWDVDNPQRITVDTVVVPFTGAVTPAFTAVQEGSDVRAARVTVTNPQTGRVYQVQWEDGAGFADIPTAGSTPNSAAHVYTTADGSKTITVRDKADPTKFTTRAVLIPWPQSVVPTITVAEEPGDATHRTARATVTNAVTGRDYEVQWLAGGVWEDIPAAGSPGYSLTHQYGAPDGQKVVTIRDKSDVTKSATDTVTIPFPQPLTPTLMFTEDANVTPRRATRVTVTNAVAGREYEALFEGGTWEDIPTTGAWANSLTHTYTSDGAKTAQVRDKNSTTTSATANATLPFTGPVFDIIQGASDMQATVTVSDPGAATFEVEWQTGTWTALAGDTGSFTYPAAGTYQVRVRDQATPADISSKQVRVPFSGGLLGVASVEEGADGAAAEPVAKKRGK